MGRPSRNWGTTNDKLLGDLLHSNTINSRNRTAEYLFSVTEEHFPNFISPGMSGRNSAIQRMQNKLVCYKQDLPEELEESLVICIDSSSNRKLTIVFVCAKKPHLQVTKKKPKKCQLSQSRLPAIPLSPS
jgi:hypothetical protein